MDILDEIVERKRRDLNRLKKLSPAELLAARKKSHEAKDFSAALAGSGTSIIAEVKRASPSSGMLRTRYDPAGIAREYERAGAAAVSVLTEEHYFNGCLEDLRRVKGSVSLPVLRKDFIVEEYQIYESAAAGADAVLLIARLLGRQELEQLVGLCDNLQLSPLVEIHHEGEIEKAVASGARLLGINNRDLKTLEVDINRTLALKDLLPPDRTVISESGIKSREEILRLSRAGVHAFLVGEGLLKTDNPGDALKKLLGN